MISTAAGSTRRCWWRWARGHVRPYRAVPHARLRGGRRGREDVEVQGQRRRPGEDHPAVRRRGAAAVGGAPATTATTCASRIRSSRALRRGLREDPQHAALRAVATSTTSTRRRTRCRRRSCCRWTRGRAARLAELVARVRRAYEAYEFHLVYHAVVDFCAADLSAVYFDILKDRLYTCEADGAGAAQRADGAARGPADVLRLLAPVMSFTAEEAWSSCPGSPTASVFLAGLPQPTASGTRRADGAFEGSSRCARRCSAARGGAAGQAHRRSLEAKVVLTPMRRGADVPRGGPRGAAHAVHREPGGAGEGPHRADGAHHGGAAWRGASRDRDPQGGRRKCPRCWTYAPEVAAGAEVCPKCQEALS